MMLFSRVFHETFLFSSLCTLLVFFVSHSRELHSFCLPLRIRRIKNYICKIYFLYSPSRSHARSLSLLDLFYIISCIFFLLFSLRHTMDFFCVDFFIKNNYKFPHLRRDFVCLHLELGSGINDYCGLMFSKAVVN